jgi:hypothetical protein
MSDQIPQAKKGGTSHDCALVLGDFAENYTFDEIQSFHWCKLYCTLHPVVEQTVNLPKIRSVLFQII